MVLLDKLKNVSQQGVLVARKASHTLGCVSKVMSRLREIILPSLWHLGDHTGAVPSFGLPFTRRTWTYWHESGCAPPRSGTWNMQHMRRGWEPLASSVLRAMEGYGEGKARLFLKIQSNRTRGNGYMLEQKKFWLVIRKTFLFTMKLDKNWCRCACRLWNMHLWKYSQFDWSGPWATAWSAGQTRWPTEVPSNLYDFMICSIFST